jgi:hypothetical protein
VARRRAACRGGRVCRAGAREQAKRRGVHVSFVDYLKVGLPVTVPTLVIDLLWLHTVA